MYQSSKLFFFNLALPEGVPYPREKLFKTLLLCVDFDPLKTGPSFLNRHLERGQITLFLIYSRIHRLVKLMSNSVPQDEICLCMIICWPMTEQSVYYKNRQWSLVSVFQEAFDKSVTRWKASLWKYQRNRRNTYKKQGILGMKSRVM